ncbi:carboxylating nicotinate-nucleotide diphosphorylase [Actinopolyspora mortivallis]|uniref:Nicotinate-nucleotide pyrophosphorylase [carboxylating] n=1 Tax=Actinopolyspora mortivallis TaxID=33906 RepID=A0A2T0GZ40_ACTMO|nr:carboxylating nicotinate-nucleotide diphosphorylase [Actinopolyspora mortivallis]PRW64386.1 nicotinate-nucleotide diphosphorylase (carboxylating) [Actinopolyspora mortivallis]
MNLSEATTRNLRAAGLDPAESEVLVRAALAEDLRYGPDATTEATVSEHSVATAEFNTRTSGVLAGLPLVLAVLDQVVGADRYRVEHASVDGSPVGAGESVLTVRAPVRTLLTAERTALNLLTHLSGVATATAAWVEAVAGTGCRIRDSRKTLPGLRVPQKYAVRCGGGENHRFGLGDAMLVKDNHVAAAGSPGAALRACREHAPDLPLEVEVGDLDELDEVLRQRPGLVLLDNFAPEQCAEAVRRAGAVSPETELEASGGLTLERAADYAATGVHCLAVGALTHSAPVLDIGLDM